MTEHTADYWQKHFDHFLLARFKEGAMTLGSIAYKFLIRAALLSTDEEVSPEQVHTHLLSLGLNRVPPLAYWNAPVGQWLMDCYPQFERAVALSQDALKIPLKYLTFNPRLAPKSKYRQASDAHRKMKHQVIVADKKFDLETRLYYNRKDKINATARLAQRGGNKH